MTTTPSEIDVARHLLQLTGMHVVRAPVRICGGLSSYVYRVFVSEQSVGADSYIVKLRGDRFSGLPHLAMEGTSGLREVHAIELISGISPALVPGVIATSADARAVVLEDLAQRATLLSDILKSNRLTTAEIETIVDAAFNATASLQRVKIPAGCPDLTLQLSGRVRLLSTGFSNAELADQFRRRLSDVEAPRVLLHGDLSPKNLFFDGDSLMLIDLDTFGVGPRYFDVSYFIAHLLLHSPPSTWQRIGTFWKRRLTYGLSALERTNVHLLVSAVMCFRLRQAAGVKYDLTYDLDTRSQMAMLLEASLLSGRQSFISEGS